MTTGRHWTKENFLSRLGGAEERADTRQTAVRRLLERAAVLSYFEPRSLSSAKPGAADDAALQELLGSAATIVYDGEGRAQWRLKDEVRKRVIKQLGPDKLKKLLAKSANRPGKDPTQKILEDYVAGVAPPPEQQSSEQLKASLEVVGWLTGVLPQLPKIEDINLQLERQAQLRPMRDLVGEHFFGRHDELARLRDYVGILPASSAYQWIYRSVRKFLSLDERPPLMIHGPGGIGKSTLLAKFILEHAQSDESLRLPFAYLNFDRPDLSLERPLALVMEILDQLSRQFRCDRRWAEKLRASWWEKLRTSKGGRRFPSDQEQEFFRFLEKGFEADLTQRPLLVVMDTFEEVQYRTPHLIETLWTLLEGLQKRWPQLRTILAGRSPEVGFKIEQLPLGDFSPDAAGEFVAYLSRDGERIDKNQIDFIVKKVGGNPLTLKLAVEAFQKIGPDSLDSLETRRLLFFQVEEGVIQGQLYLRILKHIHDRDVRRLAHPGLILRRITREIIRDVLAEPCGVAVGSDKRAEELFAQLAREAALVSPAGEGVLRHRPDVRRNMVPLLRQTEPEVTREIQTRAIRYYESRDTLEDRGEEVYHRLMLEQSTEVLDRRWRKGIEVHLGDSLWELPTLGQTYLASRLGLELDRSVWQKADLLQWERNVDSRLEELIGLGHYKKGLELLGEREERSEDSVLHLREAQIWQGLGELDKAEEVAQRGIDAGLGLRESSQLAPLLLLLVEIQESQRRWEEAQRNLERAAARSQGNPLRLLEIHLRRFQALRRANPNIQETAVAAKLSGEVEGALLRASDEELSRHPDLALQISLAFGAVSQSTLARLIRFLRLPALKMDHLSAVREWLETAGERLRGDRAVQRLMTEESPSRAVRALEQLLLAHTLPPAVLAQLVDGLRRAAAEESGEASSGPAR